MPVDRVTSLQNRQASLADRRARLDAQIREIRDRSRQKKAPIENGQDAQEALEALEKKSAQLGARMERLQGRENVEKHKLDTRRKILIGAVVLNAVEAGEYPRRDLESILDRYLTRPADRALFGLKW